MPQPIRCRFRPGFTLIELLVVISIIAILLAILLPAISQVRDRSIVIQCAANLKGFGIAHAMYETDNQALLAAVAAQWSADQVAPHWMLINQPTHGNIDPNLQYFSYEAIREYMNGGIQVDQKTAGIGGIWTCPSKPKLGTDDSDWDFYSGAINSPMFIGGYNYYGRSDWYESHLNYTTDLIQDELVPDRILMGDVIFEWTSFTFDYNHGLQGESYSLPWVGPTRSPEVITGINQLYGDGRVKWQTLNSQDIAFDKFSTTDPHIRSHSFVSEGSYYFRPE